MGMHASHGQQRKCLLAYFIYGDRREYHAEAAFSIVTARQQLAKSSADLDVEVVVLSDQRTFTVPLDARVISITRRELDTWTNHGRYNHRAKLCALARLLREDADAVALVDTDTYWVDDPAALFARVCDGQSVMHACEGPVGADSEWMALFQDPVSKARLAEVGCTEHTPMFNSGVIALSRADASLAEGALAWLDAQGTYVSAFNLEQVAVSMALQRETRVTPCDDLLVHYWGHQRPFVHVQIEERLAHERADTDGLGIPRAALRERLQSRALATLLRWSPDCRFAYQAMLCARASHERSDGYADAWAEVALEALERAHDVHGLCACHVPGLKRVLAPLERSSDWLDARTHARWDAIWQDTPPLGHAQSTH